jgi:hypothetical protein
MTALNNYRSSKEIVRANQFSALDARDLVVFAVGGAYLQTIAATARVESVRAQLEKRLSIVRMRKNAALACWPRPTSIGARCRR